MSETMAETMAPCASSFPWCPISWCAFQPWNFTFHKHVIVYQRWRWNTCIPPSCIVNDSETKCYFNIASGVTTWELQMRNQCKWSKQLNAKNIIPKTRLLTQIPPKKLHRFPQQNLCNASKGLGMQCSPGKPRTHQCRMFIHWLPLAKKKRD